VYFPEKKSWLCLSQFKLKYNLMIPGVLFPACQLPSKFFSLGTSSTDAHFLQGQLYIEVLRIALLEIEHFRYSQRGSNTKDCSLQSLIKSNRVTINKQMRSLENDGQLTVNGNRDLLDTQRIHPKNK